MNYFEVLKLSPSEIQGQDETTIKEKVEKAYLDLYSKTTGSYANVPRPDGRTQSQWQTILNKAKDILLDPAKREEHLEEVSGGAKEIVEAPPLGPIAFGGARYETPAELGMALARDWFKAESFWRRRSEYVCNWVIDELGLQSLGDELRAIDDKKTPLETQVFNLICQLAPNVPTMRFRDVDLSMEGLVALGGQAANGQDAGARATLLTLYKQEILLLAGSRPGKEALAEVAHRWDEAVSDYKHRRAEFGAQEVAVPELDDDVGVVLLAGSVPAPAVLAALRQEAHRVSTEDARACPWFRALGTPEDMSVAVLAMLPHLQAPAERQGKISRKRSFRGAPAERQGKISRKRSFRGAPAERQGKISRKRSFRGCVGGIIVGGLFGMHVRWAHEQYARDFAVDGVGDFFGVLKGVILLVVVIFAFYVAGVWYRRGG